MNLRLQVQLSADTAFPRDVLTNVLHFRSTGIMSDPDVDQLCLDLATIYKSQWNTVANRQVTVKGYEVGPPPQYPKGDATVDVGLAPASQGPREVALCLSFYSVNNIPRQRGRIYLPYCVRGPVSTVRPAAGALTGAMAMGLAFCNLGGPDIDWCIWSPTDQEMRPVTNYWCDDEWDTVRSRGLKGTMRQTATTSEA